VTLDTKPAVDLEEPPETSPVKKKRRRLRWGRWIAVSAVVVSIVVPMMTLVVWSFAFRWNFPSMLPTEWGLKSWAYVASDSSRVLEGLWNSTRLAVMVTIMAIIVGLPAARALGQNVFRGKVAIEWILLMPIIVPPLVATMGIHQVFIRLRLTGTLSGVALVHLIPAIPYFVLVMASVFANYGTELEDTARTLGANTYRVFRYVTLPAISSGLVVASMFTFLISWGQYVTTLLIGGGTFVTLPLVLFPFLAGGNQATASAISLVFIAPAIIVLIMTSRQLGRESSLMGGFGKL